MMTARAIPNRVTAKPPSSLEAASREALLRGLRAEAAREAEARRSVELAIEARVTLRVRDRVRQAVDRLQPLVTRLEAHLRDELDEATRAGDNGRRVLIEAELDALFADLNQAMRAEAGR